MRLPHRLQSHKLFVKPLQPTYAHSELSPFREALLTYCMCHKRARDYIYF